MRGSFEDQIAGYECISDLGYYMGISDHDEVSENRGKGKEIAQEPLINILSR